MKKVENTIYNIIFPCLLLLFPLWNVWVGVDVVDTGYSLTFFRFSEQLQGMWYFATLGANVVGAFLMQLPFGEYLLGINLYSSLFIGILGLLIYFILSKFMKAYLVFIGEVLAIALCWCPMVILYHSLTYLLFSLGAAVLMYAIVFQKKQYFYIAGIVLGLNAFVRMPSNLPQMILILVVWYAGYIRKDKFKEIVQQTLACVAGYMGSMVVLFIAISIRYGGDGYIEGIRMMLQSTDTASDYTLYGMLWAMAKVLLEGIQGSILLLPFLLLAVLLQFLGGSKGRLIRWTLGVGCGFIGMYCLMQTSFFDRNYYYYSSVFQLFIVVLIIGSCACVGYIFNQKKQLWERVMAGTVLLITLVMPLGTNNQFYANMNNLFLVFPFFAYMLYQFLVPIISSKNRVLLGVSGVLVAYVAVFVIQVTLFGITFVFMDNYSQEPRTYEMNALSVGEKMKTNENNGSALEELYVFLETSQYLNKKLITYGNIPGLHYFLNMEMVSSVVWPDLATSSFDIWSQDLEGAVSEQPMVVITTAVKAILEQEEVTVKEQFIKNYIDINHYEILFENAQYVVLGVAEK